MNNYGNLQKKPPIIRNIISIIFFCIFAFSIISSIVKLSEKNNTSNITISTVSGKGTNNLVSDGYRTIDITKNWSLPNAILDNDLTSLVKKAFNFFGFMSISELSDWIEEGNGSSYEITKLSEKHDQYGRYIIRINYRISEGERWREQTGYLFTRYNKTTESYQGNYSLFVPINQSLLDAINWGKDKPFSSDTHGISNFLINNRNQSNQSQADPGTALTTVAPVQRNDEQVENRTANEFYVYIASMTAAPTQRSSEQVITDSIDYHVYNAYNDGTDTTGFFYFTYKNFEFHYSVSKLEDGSKFVEASCRKVTNNESEEFYGAFYLDWDSYGQTGEAIIDNSSNEYSLGAYVQDKPSVLSIAIDSNADGSWFGSEDFILTYYAESNELKLNDGKGNETHLVYIEWPTEFNYPPD